jgi:hypothetical protein
MLRFVNMRRTLALGAAFIWVAGISACHSKSAGGEAPASSSPPAPSAAHPLDRLAPDELAAGSVSAFGFPIPARMTVERTFPDAVHAFGPVTAEALLNYVRERVFVERIEVTGTRSVFPKVRIKGAPLDRVYHIEIAAEGPKTLLVIRDVTPPPMVEGISQAERWRRAGMSPDGKPLNPKQMQ